MPELCAPQAVSRSRSPTRDRILDASLALFNDEGVGRSSTHRIAADACISNGNLHYHFKTKQAIVAVLFNRFEHSLTPCIEAISSASALDDLWLALHILFEVVDQYRFICRDVESVVAECPSLELRVQSLTAAQLMAARSMCDRLAHMAVIDASSEDVEMLAMQIVFSTTCWFTFKRMVPQPAGRRHSESALAAFYTLTLLSPYVRGASREYLRYLRAKYLG